MNDVLAYVAAGIVGAWGVSHIMPTRRVVAGFGDLSRNNRLVITMEWVAEGLGFLFVAALLVAVTVAGEAVATTYLVSAAFLLVVGLWTGLTGARVSGPGSGAVFFRMCPAVMAVSAALLMIAAAV